MKLLLDTHILLWAAEGSPRLTTDVRRRILDPINVPLFSAASLWEIAIKNALGRPDFQVDPVALRQGLLAGGYVELAVTGVHAIAVSGLLALHGDPFDRLLIAQARCEGAELLTADRTVARYGAPVRLI